MSVSYDVVFFEVRGRRCAIAVSAVREVLATPAVTPVPLGPVGLRGVVPVRGHGVPLVDVAPWLGAGNDGRPDPSARATNTDNVLLLEVDVTGEAAPVRAALAVDRVSEIATIDESHARPAPPGAPFVRALLLEAGGAALLLDAGAALATIIDATRIDTTRAKGRT